MPIYEYRAEDGATGCEQCRAGFEALQRLSDERLETCPDCGSPVRRVVSAPHVQRGEGQVLSEDNLSRHGFTQYKKAGDGVYEKTAGKGPATIADDGK